jgi:hypothetical protein
MGCCGQNHDEKLKEALEYFESIGEKSLLLINKNRNEKNETWEKAIEINNIARNGHDILKNSQGIS